MATLMPGSAIRLPRALPAWLRVRPRSARDQGPRLVLGLIGGLLVIQAVRLLWALTVPLSPSGAWQPHTAPIASPADRKSVVQGTSVSVRVDPGGLRQLKTKTHHAHI